MCIIKLLGMKKSQTLEQANVNIMAFVEHGISQRPSIKKNSPLLARVNAAGGCLFSDLKYYYPIVPWLISVM